MRNEFLIPMTRNDCLIERDGLDILCHSEQRNQ